MSTTTRVLLGLALGATIGLLLAIWHPTAATAAADIAYPVGKLWLNALQMTVVPLVAALVVIGVNAATDAATSGRTARRAMAVFAILLTLAGTFAVVVAPLLLSLAPHDPSFVAALRGAMDMPQVAAGTTAGFGEMIAAIVPSNAIAAAAASSMLPLVVFSMFTGFALTRIDAARRERLLELVQAVADTMIVIVRWVLWAAPLGVFALVLTVCARVGVGVLGALAWYIALMCTLYILVTLLLYGVSTFVAREPLRRFAPALVPAQTIAASTQSSLASLPAMVDSARVRLGYPLQVTSLVLPMAVSLFRVTSPVQYMGVVTFIAWLYGFELTPLQMAIGVALSVVVSMGSVGLPGQVSFMATNMPVTQAMGLPVEPLGVLLAIDTIPDAFATVGNVTGDLTATAVVAKRTPTPDAAPPETPA